MAPQSLRQRIVELTRTATKGMSDDQKEQVAELLWQIGLSAMRDPNIHGSTEPTIFQFGAAVRGAGLEITKNILKDYREKPRKLSTGLCGHRKGQSSCSLYRNYAGNHEYL